MADRAGRDGHAAGVRASGGVRAADARADEPGTGLAWGTHTAGQLGNGTTTQSSTTPVQVCAVGETAPCTDFLTGITAVASGIAFNAALRADGTVVTWGGNNVGQLGIGTNTDSNVG
ncbi:hypothetical protein [Streptomyces sp. NPDC051079]|uniref:hypothetical protein n=1 Tax=Streptomyces sp. NPDC051079 TaxID=3155043 RepID=UPI00344C1969